MCNERATRHADMVSEIERLYQENEILRREIEWLKDDGLVAAYLDGVERGKSMVSDQIKKIAMNNWLGGK